jgi:hypothetical protein
MSMIKAEFVEFVSVDHISTYGKGGASVSAWVKLGGVQDIVRIIVDFTGLNNRCAFSYRSGGEKVDKLVASLIVVATATKTGDDTPSIYTVVDWSEVFTQAEEAAKKAIDLQLQAEKKVKDEQAKVEACLVKALSAVVDKFEGMVDIALDAKLAAKVKVCVDSSSRIYISATGKYSGNTEVRAVLTHEGGKWIHDDKRHTRNKWSGRMQTIGDKTSSTSLVATTRLANAVAFTLGRELQQAQTNNRVAVTAAAVEKMAAKLTDYGWSVSHSAYSDSTASKSFKAGNGAVSTISHTFGLGPQGELVVVKTTTTTTGTIPVEDLLKV